MSKIAQALEKAQKQFQRSEHSATNGDTSSVFVHNVNEKLGHRTAWDDARDFLIKARLPILVAASSVFLVIFLFGVHQGMKIEKTSHREPVVPAADLPVPEVTVTVVTEDPVSEKPAAKPAEINAAAGPLTLQLISYANKSRADQEVMTLQSRGYEAFRVPQGRFHTVCLYRFSTREEGETLLARLKKEGLLKTYRGAFIRNAPRN